MGLHGKNFLGGKLSARGTAALSGINPATGEALAPLFHEATEGELDEALALAERAFEDYRCQAPERVAEFLERMADAI